MIPRVTGHPSGIITKKIVIKSPGMTKHSPHAIYIRGRPSREAMLEFPRVLPIMDIISLPENPAFVL